MLFSDLPLHAELQRTLRKLNQSRLTLIQEQIIPVFLQSTDIVLDKRLGHGKNAAFIVPILDNLAKAPARGQAIYALFLTSNAKATSYLESVVNLYAQNLSVHTLALYANAPSPWRNETPPQIDILIATPTALLKFLPQIDLSTVQILVVDEIDVLMGKNIQKGLGKIMDILPKIKKTALMYLEFTPELQKFIDQELNQPKVIRIMNLVESIKGLQHLSYAVDPPKKLLLLKNLLGQYLGKKVLIFVRTRYHVYELANALGDHFPAESLVLHAQEVDMIHKQALESSKRIFITTDYYVAKIPYETIDCIINYEFPSSIHNYVNRVEELNHSQLGVVINFIGSTDRLLFDKLQNLTDKIIKIMPVEDLIQPVHGLENGALLKLPVQVRKPRKLNTPFRRSKPIKSKVRIVSPPTQDTYLKDENKLGVTGKTTKETHAGKVYIPKSPQSPKSLQNPKNPQSPKSLQNLNAEKNKGYTQPPAYAHLGTQGGWSMAKVNLNRKPSIPDPTQTSVDVLMRKGPKR
ncbi:MAG: DEAD/DEAH box helicase [Gammaproteobacteria bacterium]|nr:DEAD/DEAH box helicase [Gammaproteobacteria bacterium]